MRTHFVSIPTFACAATAPQMRSACHMNPLRRLNADDLRQYTDDALLAWGDVDDLKHFLPRILELLVSQGNSFVDPQVALGKLYQDSWQSWADREQCCIRVFLKAL